MNVVEFLFFGIPLFFTKVIIKNYVFLLIPILYLIVFDTKLVSCVLKSSLGKFIFVFISAFGAIVGVLAFIHLIITYKIFSISVTELVDLLCIYFLFAVLLIRHYNLKNKRRE